MNDLKITASRSPAPVAGRISLASDLPAVAAALVVAANFVFIDRNSFFVDELFSVNASLENSVSRMLSEWVFSDVHPPLYQLILMGWMDMFGSSEVAVRSLSVLYYCLAVIAAYGFSFVLVGRRPAGLVALFTSLAPLALFYAHEARGYSQVLLLSTLGFYLWALWRTEVAGQAALYGCFAVLVLLSATHLFGVIFSGGILLVVFLRGVWQRRYSVLAAAAVTGLLCLFAIAPNIAVRARMGMIGGDFWIRGGLVYDIKQIYGALPLAILPTEAGPLEMTAWGLLLLIPIGAAVYLVYARGRSVLAIFHGRERSVLALAVWTSAFTVLAALVVSLYSPIITYRNFIVLLPQLCLILALAAAGMSRALTRRTAAAVFAAIIASQGLASRTWLAQRIMPREDFKSAAEFIAGRCDKDTDVGLVIQALSSQAQDNYQSRRIEQDIYQSLKINQYYLGRILKRLGKECGRIDLVHLSNFANVAKNFDYLQIVHLRESNMKSLLAQIRKGDYEVVSFPTSKEYPTLVVMPQHRRSGK